ncbi:polyprenol monophosphomannose synthase [Aeromicrobium endophyticum]|uniref:Polyprenol monophosphomannose synthase n=1 Tax=Aeromicrobium endophyticum TaxID=2292704 RepID=A0A371PAX5_9ACTN|nr:polyprenol monophosphomannose synthase [Aeromicrobium endophyticum]REK72610.1 polyprenol monophosphomannose synthase [Aeromicrobium endophyticum]
MSDAIDADGRVLVIVPTYDERDNIVSIIDRTLAASERHHVLVVDDGSPDGTGDLVETIAASNDRVDVLHRTGKLGLGSAYILGFGWGLERGFELLVEMDADGSHAPESLPGMVQRLGPEGALVIGSRWVSGGAVVDWPLSRQLLSRGGNAYARLALGIHVKDATAGFRVYRADVLRRIDLGSIDSKGYCFQVDMTLRVLDAGGSIVEHPITFRERERGESKMSRGIVAEAMWKVTLWGIARRFRRLVRRR